MPAAPVEIIISPDNSTASSLGQTFMMSCVAVSSADLINITWQHDSQHLSMSNMKVLPPTTLRKGGLLIVKSVLEVCVNSIENGGEYSCTASAHPPSEDNPHQDRETFHIDSECLHKTKGLSTLHH